MSRKRNRNGVTIGLMCSSMILLLVLQYFWLRGAYGDAAEDFRKETNAIFRNTIFSMHDSLMQRSLVPVADSLPSKIVFRQKTLKINEQSSGLRNRRDSLGTYIDVAENTAQIEIFTSEKNDSVIRKLGPLVSRMQMAKEPRTFVFRMDADSLNRDSISHYYADALDKAGIDAKFKIIKIKGPHRFTDELITRREQMFMSEAVPFTPMIRYAVSFAGAPVLIWREITPQLLFGLFLTVLTGISFIAMYRNLRAQQRLMDIKNDFISNITHELKTPVATVSVALEALKNFNVLQDAKRTEEYLDIAQRELNRLTLMTDKILKTSVHEDHGVKIDLGQLDLDKVAEKVLSSMKLVFEKKGSIVRFNCEGHNFTMQGSEEHITNVLYNLVDNALKYGGDNPQIYIGLYDEGESVRLTVRDSGIGIPREFLDKVFEKFFRVPSGDVHNIKGYGLGLSYVSSVIESHGGTIAVESEPGKGSCFIINLPKRQRQ